MLLLAHVLTALILSYGLAIADDVPTVQLGNTTVSGIAKPGLSQEYFLGIPFAEAPAGNLRFAPPVLKLSLGNTTFDASAFGPECPQFGVAVSPGMDISEDCLSVNVMRPAGIDASNQVPVLVWIFGGGFISEYNSSTG